MKIQRLEEISEIPEFREYSEEEVKQAYALAKATFTADDLQLFTEVDKGVSADDVLALMEDAQKQIDLEKA
jgi:hypothetical protein